MDPISNILHNGYTKAGGFVVGLGLLAGALKYLREIVREFKTDNRARRVHEETYRAHWLFQKCFDAALILVKHKLELEQLPKDQVDREFRETVEGTCNDVFPQNGIDPRNFKFEYMIDMEIYKRFKTIKLPKEVI